MNCASSLSLQDLSRLRMCWPEQLLATAREKRVMKRYVTVIAAAVWGLFAVSAQAAPITYTFTSSSATGNFQVTGSPNLNFSAQPMTITVAGDTDDVMA